MNVKCDEKNDFTIFTEDGQYRFSIADEYTLEYPWLTLFLDGINIGAYKINWFERAPVEKG